MVAASLNKAGADQTESELAEGRAGERDRKTAAEKKSGKKFRDELVDDLLGSLPAAGVGIRQQPEGRGERSEAETSRGPEAEDCQAPDLCNTGAMNRQEGKESSENGREAGGLDTLHVGLYGEWEPDAFTELVAEWDACKQAAEDGDEEGAMWTSATGHAWNMQAAGAKVGVYCRWVAEWSGCRLYVVRRQEASSSMHAIFVQVGSLVLMTRGIDRVWEELRGMLAAIGFRLHGHKLSRVDVCVDLPGVQVKQFTALALGGHEVTRANRGNLMFGKTADDHETFYRGQRRVLMRIYDKVKETEHEPEKRAILEEKRWGGEVDQATRVEFQITREPLKERWQIDTLDDLRVKLPQLTTWLTAEWYRLAASAVDRKNNNQTRVGMHWLWQQVQDAFAAWVGVNTIPTVLPRKVLRPKVEQLLKQALGCFVTAFACGERVYGDAVELGNVAMEIVAASSEQLFEALGIKRQQLAIELGPAIAGAGDTPF